jgi:hypothetical protein
MTTLDPDDGEKAALVALLTAQIKNTRSPLAPRTKALRAILDRLDPLFPRPKPVGGPRSWRCWRASTAF